MEAFDERLKVLANSEKQYGKIFDQLANVVAHLQLLKQASEDVAAPRIVRKRKPK
jgi:hypothetical protein